MLPPNMLLSLYAYETQNYAIRCGGLHAGVQQNQNQSEDRFLSATYPVWTSVNLAHLPFFTLFLWTTMEKEGT